MKKNLTILTIILSIAIFLLLTSTAFAGDLSVSPSSETKAGNIDEKISSILRISNANAGENLNTVLPLSIILKGTRNNETASVTYNTSSPVSIPANGFKDVNYSFNIPSDSFAESYTGIFNFTSGGNSTAYTLTLGVNPSPQASFSNVSRIIPRGYSRTFDLSFENTGNTDISISLGKNDLISQTNTSNKITADKLSLSTASFNVQYQKTETATLTITVPADTPLEIYDGELTVIYAGIQKALKLTVIVSEQAFAIETPSRIDFPSGEYNTTQTAEFTIKNIGNVDLTNVKVTSSADARYNNTINATSPFSINSGETKTIKINTIIPQKEKIESHLIGGINIQSDQKNFTGPSLYISTATKLEIEDMDFLIKGDFENKDSSDPNLNEGDLVDVKAKPTSEITMEFKIRNKYAESLNNDFRDVKITATIRDIDDGSDVELETDEFDIDSGELSSRQAVSYTIPITTEEDTYNVDILVEGDDDLGVTHVAKRTITFKVDKKSRDLIIKTANLFPDTISCSRKLSAQLKFVNAGKDDEETVKATITNDALGINFAESNIKLAASNDEDENTYSKTATFFISNDVPAGQYPIAFKVYLSEDALFAANTNTLIVNNCLTNKLIDTPEDNEDTDTSEDDVQENKTIITPPDETPEEDSEEDTIVVGEKPLMENPVFIVTLILVNFLVLGVIIFFFAKVMAKKE